MRVLPPIAIAIVAFEFGAWPSDALADSNMATFPDDSRRNITCQCIPFDSPATTACTFKNLDSLSNDQAFPTWTISITPPPDSEVDLSGACWRKRSAPGDGVCCSKTGDASDTQYFWGELQQ
jgi:hypothetical protein